MFTRVPKFWCTTHIYSSLYRYISISMHPHIFTSTYLYIYTWIYIGPYIYGHLYIYTSILYHIVSISLSIYIYLYLYLYIILFQYLSICGNKPTISMRPHLWRWLCRGCAMNFETWNLPPVGRRGAKMGVVYLPKKNPFLGDCRTLFCVRHFRFIWDFISCHMVCFYSKTEIRLWCCTVFF